jgi:Ca2+-binding EF-hand superfamily protein
MKTIAILLVSTIMAVSAIAQTVSTVTINVRGNNNDAIIIDGREYAVANDYTTNTNPPIVVSNLQAGQHTLQIRRSNEVNPSSTVFTIRTGYDLQITITANGAVQSRETKWRSDNNNAQYTTPMSDADFTNLYNSVRRQWRSASRTKLLSDAFASTSNYFTTAQASQLIQLINNQSDRFTLAKASYRGITDPMNFTQIYSLFNSQSYRDQLANYVSTYNVGSSSTAMTTARFNTIYRTAQRQPTTNSKVSYIYNIFTNTNNYLTVSQTRQLVQLVPDEANRLYLAKVSYRSVIDKNNFSQIYTLLNNQSSRNELSNFVNTYSDSNNPVYAKVAMKEDDFNVLYRDVQNRYGLNAKMTALGEVFANENYYFTVAQAKQLIQLVSSESNRLELAMASYNNIVDQVNFNQLYDVLSSTASRNELENYVRGYQTTPASTSTVSTRTPMSTSSFSALYDDVRNTFGLGAKMSRLTDIFDNETYYFTVAQAKQLIQLVSAESNRLQLAKSAYGNITDPENFNLMYDLLTSQSSKNELSSYVNTYSYNR